MDKNELSTVEMKLEDVNNDVSSKSKKKDKKKSGGKESKSTKEETKEANYNKRLAKIRESIAKQKEEDERIRIEREEEERRLEEERLKEVARITREKEIKEKKKQKEKERKQRLKEEGKLLTSKQKEDRRKALELLQARGMELPDENVVNKKKPTYSKLKKRPTIVTKEEPKVIDEAVITERDDNGTVQGDLDSWEVLADAVKENVYICSSNENSMDELDEYCIIGENVANSKLQDSELPEDEKLRLIDLAKQKIWVRNLL